MLLLSVTVKGSFALDQATGEQKWTTQLSGAILSPSLIESGRVITLANDGTVFAHDVVTGQQVWAYKLQMFSLAYVGSQPLR